MAAGRPRIYLDHNSTSPLRPEARAALEEALESATGNASSIHAEGRASRGVLETARRQIAAFLGASPDEIVFTSGGSEAIASGVRGVCERAPRTRRTVLVSRFEHSAVLEEGRRAEGRGFEIRRIGCDRRGRIDLAAFRDALGPEVALACLQWANHETGVIQPVEEAGRACREAGVAFFVDAVQAAGKLEIDLRRLQADLLALSGHKLGAPQGTGALVVRRGIVLAPLIAGGAQEQRRRAGTEAVAALAGFGAAARAAGLERPREAERLCRLRAKLETRLKLLEPEIRFHGEGVPRLPNTLNFALPDVRGETLVIALDLAGIALSTGSACASGGVEPSHVIQAMGYDEAEARSAVRLSLGWSTTEDDVGRFLELFSKVVAQVRAGEGREGRPA
jgi:cysteine desulfurase